MFGDFLDIFVTDFYFNSMMVKEYASLTPVKFYETFMAQNMVVIMVSSTHSAAVG